MTLMTFRFPMLCLAAMLALLLRAPPSSAQVPAQVAPPAGEAVAGGAGVAGVAGDSDWVGYRDAYRQMIWFEKYGKPKQFLQSHYRVRLRDANGSTDGLRLTLDSKSAHLDLPLDAVGRAIFPFSKAAYDDNVQLTLNRKAGQFKFEPWVSIVSRTDGVYDAADLRVACEQMLAYLRYVGAAWVNGKACTGVQFAYAKNDSDAEV